MRRQVMSSLLISCKTNTSEPPSQAPHSCELSEDAFGCGLWDLSAACRFANFSEIISRKNFQHTAGCCFISRLPFLVEIGTPTEQFSLGTAVRGI
jgi:hypothetical protein